MFIICCLRMPKLSVGSFFQFRALDDLVGLGKIKER